MATVPLNYRVEPELREAIGAAAKHLGQSQTEFAKRALSDAIARTWGQAAGSSGGAAKVVVRPRQDSVAASSSLKADDEEWLTRRVRQLKAQGMASPLARTEALRELAARAADRV